MAGFEKSIDGKKVLVTGGTGSFGHQVTSMLLEHGPEEIIIFSRDENKQHHMRSEYNSPKLKFVIGDVRDYERVKEVTKNVDIIFHAAALKHVPYCEFHPYEAFKTNVVGAHNVKRAAIENDVQRLIAISTDKAVKPVNAMGMSKAMQEKLLLNNNGKESNTVISCVRYGNVIGSRGSVMPLFESKVKAGQPLPITSAKMTRFMLTLPQAINLVFYALQNANGGEIFVKKAPACRMVDFAQAYAEAITGKAGYPLEVVGVRPGEKIHEVLVAREEMHRAKEADDYFIIEPYKSFYTPVSENTDNAEEYGSNTTVQMPKQDILKLLKETKWID
ncbi:MAG: SDR family NAD(P)-dependent oxidoreductase [Candidatus Aenigmarchaeota archaeon]|nr:SDR family NAD(P)-dependent oxidoreductase [Candidatus Aenigmarchaeota archaeon]